MSRTVTISDHLYDRLAAEARSDGSSSVEEWLQKLAGTRTQDAERRISSLTSRTREDPTKIGHALDEFMGDWSAKEQASFLEAVSVFDQIDESLWK